MVALAVMVLAQDGPGPQRVRSARRRSAIIAPLAIVGCVVLFVILPPHREAGVRRLGR